MTSEEDIFYEVHSATLDCYPKVHFRNDSAWFEPLGYILEELYKRTEYIMEIKVEPALEVISDGVNDEVGE